MQLARSAQRLSRAGAVRVLPGVVDQDDGNAKAALQFAKEREQNGDL